MEIHEIHICVEYSKAFLGIPYKWGGQNPLEGEGFDCSGFIQFVLASVGYDPPGDQTAQTLYNEFETIFCNPEGGALAFYLPDAAVKPLALAMGI